MSGLAAGARRRSPRSRPARARSDHGSPGATSGPSAAGWGPRDPTRSRAGHSSVPARSPSDPAAHERAGVAGPRSKRLPRATRHRLPTATCHAWPSNRCRRGARQPLKGCAGNGPARSTEQAEERLPTPGRCSPLRGCAPAAPPKSRATRAQGGGRFDGSIDARGMTQTNAARHGNIAGACLSKRRGQRNLRWCRQRPQDRAPHAANIVHHRSGLLG
jgi:hypothetical protein